MKYVEVAVKGSMESCFDYLVPEKWRSSIKEGDKVLVSFRKKKNQGYVFRLKETSSCKNVLPLLNLLPEERLSRSLFDLGIWMSSYYASSLSKTLFCFSPSILTKKTEEKMEKRWLLNQPQKAVLQEIAKLRLTFPKRASVLEKLLKNKELSSSSLTGFSSQIKTLVKKGWALEKTVKKTENWVLEEDYFQTEKKLLNAEQKNAFERVLSSMKKNHFFVHLIHGITGSGKTEIYLQLTEEALSLGKGVIILVPEVALTSQLIEKFRGRFQEPIALIHHQRSPSEKRKDYQAMQMGKIRIALGARSAVFAPIQNLGLLVVDEEHDSSYKQTEEMPTYHARDIAIKRGSMEKAAVLLGSATPSLESYYKASQGKYELHKLTKRAKSSSLAPISIVSMQEEYEKAGGFTHFSRELIKKMQDRMAKGEQTLLLFNRRGYRTSRVCLSCSKPLLCKFCDIPLTFHKKENVLRCHLCHFNTHPPRACPYCSSVDTLTYKGFGTEHVESSLKALIPEIRTLRMDRDTTAKKGGHEEIFRKFLSGKADVLIGTQMIAKGFHFPSVTLVGVLNPEKMLFLPDFRSPEKVFQLITQVAGRAGREDLAGEVIIQTHLPKDPTILKAKTQNFLSLYQEEIEGRELFSYPPFSRFVKITFSSTKKQELFSLANQFETLAKKTCPKAHFYPLQIPSHEKIKNRYRMHLLLRTQQINHLTKKLKELKNSIKASRSFRILIDVDPISTI